MGAIYSDLAGKVVLVTGGASGIGAACATTLAREGGKVVVTDLDDAGGQAVVEKIGGADGKAFFLHQDVSIEESWPGVIEATNRRFGRLDIMMANAGIGILCKAVEMSLTDWRRQTAVNLDGVFLSVKYAVPAMRHSGGGSVIIMSSVAGLRGSAGLAGHCATKGGVRLFAKAVAMECAAQRDGIRVNTVHPGVIDTPIAAAPAVEATANAVTPAHNKKAPSGDTGPRRRLQPSLGSGQATRKVGAATVFFAADRVGAICPNPQRNQQQRSPRPESERHKPKPPCPLAADLTLFR